MPAVVWLGYVGPQHEMAADVYGQHAAQPVTSWRGDDRKVGWADRRRPGRILTQFSRSIWLSRRMESFMNLAIRHSVFSSLTQSLNEL